MKYWTGSTGCCKCNPGKNTLL